MSLYLFWCPFVIFKELQYDLPTGTPSHPPQVGLCSVEFHQLEATNQYLTACPKVPNWRMDFFSLRDLQRFALGPFWGIAKLKGEFLQSSNRGDNIISPEVPWAKCSMQCSDGPERTALQYNALSPLVGSEWLGFWCHVHPDNSPIGESDIDDATYQRSPIQNLAMHTWKVVL